MSAQVTPAFNRRRPVQDSDAFRQQELEKNRFLFSPLLVIDTRYDLAGIKGDTIHPGIITEINAFPMQIQNVTRIQEGPSSSAPELIWQRRLPGVIANVILRNNAEDDAVPTGLCELIELRGMVPSDSPEQAELITDLQVTLWPETHTEGQRQLESLYEVDLSEKPAIYEQIRARLVQAVETALAYADVRFLNLIDELSQRAAGGEGAKGRRNKVDNEDRRMCAYLGREIPVIASPLVQNRVKEIQKEREEVKTAPAVPQVQCLNCGAMSNVIVATGRPPKLCANCGNEFEPEDKPKAKTGIQRAAQEAK